MEQYQVTGMSCAACSNRVEKAVSAVEGVIDLAGLRTVAHKDHIHTCLVHKRSKGEIRKKAGMK